MPGRVGLRSAPFETARPRLEPMTIEGARAILAGDLSGLTVAEGWPHGDTADGLAMAVNSGCPPGWLITASCTVIGDCGTQGPVDGDGCVEIT